MLGVLKVAGATALCSCASVAPDRKPLLKAFAEAYAEAAELFASVGRPTVPKFKPEGVNRFGICAEIVPASPSL
jgi:hypothetical protein